MRGRYFANRSSGEGFRRAIDYFSQAIEREPSYSLAHAGMADCYGYSGFYGFIPPTESWPKARAAATMSLEIDDSLAEGHASLGLVELFYDWNPQAGYERCRRAAELNANYMPAYTHAAACLVAMLQNDETAVMMERARALDPLSVWVHTVAGLFAYMARDYEQAVRVLQSALELEPRSGETRRALGITYLQLNQVSLAIEELEAARALVGDTPPALGSLVRAYGRAGMVAQAENLLSQLESMSRENRVAAASTAAAYLGLGRNDLALEWLQQAVRDRSSWLVWIDAEPWWDPLRTDVKFKTIRDQIKSPAGKL